MIDIVPCAERHRDGVAALIVPIQRSEFGIPITLEAQPDLLDIGNGEGALRKMFVQAPFRGPTHGVAQRLLAALLRWCGMHGFRGVYLGTTAKFLAAHRFYEKNGFREIAQAELPPAFPVMSG